MLRRLIFSFLFFVLSACGLTPSVSTPIAPPQTEIALTPTKSVFTSRPEATATPPLQVHQSNIEVLTDNAAIGDGTGNSWGGHQSRIVHTQDGVFTAYILPGGGIHNREWQLVKRQNDGTWLVLAKGNAGRNPVNLLASPDGTLHVIGWPNAIATMWSGKPRNNTLTMASRKIPNQISNYFPYDSAGTDANGDLCIASSEGGIEPLGSLKWACFIASLNQWVTQTVQLDYRYAYTYVFPKQNLQLSLVATRDVTWNVLGYKQPAGSFDFVFNAFRYWRTNDVASEPLRQISFAEEAPAGRFSNVALDVRDAYLDTKDRMHILYSAIGPTTGGNLEVRHRIISSDGTVLYDGEIQHEAGNFVRIFQDKEQRFYILSSSGSLYPLYQDGKFLGNPFKLNFGGYEIDYSGFGLSVPRTGTPLSNVMDIVFPSSNGTKWLYFQLDLSSQ